MKAKIQLFNGSVAFPVIVSFPENQTEPDWTLVENGRSYDLAYCEKQDVSKIIRENVETTCFGTFNCHQCGQVWVVEGKIIPFKFPTTHFTVSASKYLFPLVKIF